jgi:hypothetical protein
MAVGDLITVPYQFEYNNLLIGHGTSYDVLEVNGLLGYDTRTDTANAFGRHGGSGGRHYAQFKNWNIKGTFLATTDADFQLKRQNLLAAYAPIVDPNSAINLAFMIPGAGTLICVTKCRCVGVNLPMQRDFALKHADYNIRMESIDPVIYNRVLNSQTFTMPSDTRTINNIGNAPANWIGTLTGACTNPIITNNETGQVISFFNMTLSASDVLIFDSSDSTVKLNGTPSSGSLTTGFSWWYYNPGGTSTSFTASGVSGASFNITTSDAYWSN